MTHVWYAAYGSNLSRARFDVYLRGGTPEGATHEYPGCRDPADPLEDRALEIDRELMFGGTSHTWGGGVALVDPDVSGKTKARLYLISLEQFEDVVAQENWLACGSVRLGHTEDEISIGSERVYGLVVALGPLDGRPVLTVTQQRGTAIAKPSVAYLRHIAIGLREAHGLDTDEAATYLLGKRGVAGAYTSAELIDAIG